VLRALFSWLIITHHSPEWSRGLNQRYHDDWRKRDRGESSILANGNAGGRRTFRERALLSAAATLVHGPLYDSNYTPSPGARYVAHAYFSPIPFALRHAHSLANGARRRFFSPAVLFIPFFTPSSGNFASRSSNVHPPYSLTHSNRLLSNLAFSSLFRRPKELRNRRAKIAPLLVIIGSFSDREVPAHVFSAC